MGLSNTSEAQHHQSGAPGLTPASIRLCSLEIRGIVACNNPCSSRRSPVLRRADIPPWKFFYGNGEETAAAKLSHSPPSRRTGASRQLVPCTVHVVASLDQVAGQPFRLGRFRFPSGVARRRSKGTSPCQRMKVLASVHD